MRVLHRSRDSRREYLDRKWIMFDHSKKQIETFNLVLFCAHGLLESQCVESVTRHAILAPWFMIAKSEMGIKLQHRPRHSQTPHSIFLSTIHTYLHVCYMYEYTYTYTCIHIYWYLHTHILNYVCTYIYKYIDVYIYIYIHTYVYVCIYICVHT